MGGLRQRPTALTLECPKAHLSHAIALTSPFGGHQNALRCIKLFQDLSRSFKFAIFRNAVACGAVVHVFMLLEAPFGKMRSIPKAEETLQAARGEAPLRFCFVQDDGDCHSGEDNHKDAWRQYCLIPFDAI